MYWVAVDFKKRSRLRLAEGRNLANLGGPDIVR